MSTLVDRDGLQNRKRPTDNHSNTQDDDRRLQEDTLGRALDAIESAVTSGLDKPSTEAVHTTLTKRQGLLCQINDAGGFSFVRNLYSDRPEAVHFTPQETVALWHFWRVLGYADMALGVMKAAQARAEASHE